MLLELTQRVHLCLYCCQLFFLGVFDLRHVRAEHLLCRSRRLRFDQGSPCRGNVNLEHRDVCELFDCLQSVVKRHLAS